MVVSGVGEVAQALQGEAVADGVGDDAAFVPVGEVGDDVEPGGDPAHGHGGRLVGEYADEPVATSPVGEAGPADLSVVRSAGDELGEGELVDGAGEGAPGSFDLDDLVDELARQYEPTEPEPRGQALRRRPGVAWEPGSYEP